jgi:hypothetical protein
MSDKCASCDKSVFANEKVKSVGNVYHKECFKCSNETCKRGLEQGKEMEHDHKPYCKACHNALYGPKGYGFGGSMISTGKTVKDT